MEVDDRLIEIDYGEWEGRPFTDLDPDVVAPWRRDSAFVPPDGESLEVVAGRAAPFCDERLDDRVVVAVSHVSPIKAAVTWTLAPRPSSPGACASTSPITRIGQGPVLLSFNESVDMRI